MEEEVNESVNNLEVAEQEEVVENTANETETTEQEQVEEAEQVEEVKEIKQDENRTEKQSDEENTKYASIRRKAQEDAKKQIEKVKKEAYEQGLNQGKVQSYIGRNNPYTGQIIKDEYDVQEYLDMYELDLKGEDPITGYRELQKDKARKEAEAKIKAEEQNKQELWYQNDTKDFVEKYSVEKLQELTKDEDFNAFANGKIGTVPLAQIYEDYQKFISKFEKKSVDTAKQIVANNSTTPGAIEDTEVQDLDWNSMSSEQFEKYIQKAKDGELK